MFMKKVTKSIIIQSRKYSYDIGCRLLKLKHTECPFPELSDIWDDIEPLTFKEISKFENIEDRRVGILCLGIERLTKEVKPILVDTKTIKKKTSWVNEDGELITKNFDDTYKLYKVKNSVLGTKSWREDNSSVYFVECKDTSTDRQYLIWVDMDSVKRTNHDNMGWGKDDKIPDDAIEAIAWTITTNVPKGKIKEIVRQGDCILIKPKDKSENGFRHLTKEEYMTLLVSES